MRAEEGEPGNEASSYLPFRIFFVLQHAGIELGPHRYDATLLTSRLFYTSSHKPRIVHTTSLNFHTRLRAGEVGGAH